MTAKEVVENYWKAMATNDFYSVAKEWLTTDFEVDWPLSYERIVGQENIAAINTNYPTDGVWTFTINSIVAEGDQVVTDVTVSDGVVEARAITFSTVRGDKISRQIEYWPEPYEAPEWRKEWVVG